MARQSRALAILGLVLALIAAGCGDGDGSGNEDHAEISMAIIVDNLPVDENVRGFKTRMEEAGYVVGETVDYRERNAFGQIDRSELIARQSYDDEPDLVYVVGTPIVISLHQLQSDIPTVFSLMTDPVGGGVVDSFEDPGGTFTGTSDAVDATVYFEALLEVAPETESVGILGNTSEQNTQAQIEEFTAVAEGLGLTVVVAPVQTTNDIVPAVRSLEGRVDAVVVGADGTVISGSDTVIQATIDSGLPLVIAGSDFASDGALIGIGPDFYQLGVASAEIVLQILDDGKDPSEIPVVDAVTGGGLYIAVNTDTAEAIGLELPTDLPETYELVQTQ